ncbi:MAG: DUF4062 domain-containing protein, partial [Pseudomonadales bacterium]|nr:DUF4062 domain-containing protein [Pseudomonadales bacterium]
MTEQVPSPQFNSRNIRIFLSSTFMDMNAERNYLLTKVMPELRRICRERAVTLTEIDLRWGVSEEDSRNGLTVELCLMEIDNCRNHPPFFIGFLGERYGWIPRHHDLLSYWESRKESPYAQRIQQALEQGISVTELEMRYAFLENPSASDHARIFLRSKELTDALFAEQENPQREGFYDPADNKLDTLKDELRSGPFVGIDGYKSVEQFGQAVYEFLYEQIDNIYPSGSAPSTEEQRERSHKIYSASRRQEYVPLPDMRNKVLHAIIDAADAGKSGYVLIRGESGLGKSALIADLQLWLPTQGNYWVHCHHTGSDGSHFLDDWVLRILNALKSSGHLSDPISESVKQRWEDLPMALRSVQQGLNQTLVVLLDALDQMHDEDVIGRLSELFLVPGVVLVATATPQIEVPVDRWQILTMDSLNQSTRRAMIEAYLKRFDKNLDPALLNTIVADDATRVPLFLRLMLEELRLHAAHETLGVLAQELLATNNAAALFKHVLQGLDRDFVRPNQTNLASQAAQLLALSWRGLFEHDLSFLLASPTDDCL